MENEETKIEVTVEAEAETKTEIVDAPVEKKKAAPAVASAPKIAKDAVVGGGDTDPVHLDKCVYMNKFARKSLTIHHLQRRLAAMGYRDAYSDKDGWYGELTKKAVSEFQRDRGIDGDGEMNAATFEAIFAGDPNVTVIL